MSSFLRLSVYFLLKVKNRLANFRHSNCPDFARTVPVFGMLSRCPQLNQFVPVWSNIFMISSRWGVGSQVKNGQNLDRSGWLQGGGGGGGEEICRNWMSRAVISVSVISIQTVFQIGVWFCY